MKLTTTTLKRLVLIEQKKFGAESRLRRQIREHVSALLEDDAAASGMSEADLKKLNALNQETPKDVKGFSESLSNISKILGGLNPAPEVDAAKLKSTYDGILNSIAEMMKPAAAPKGANPAAAPASGTQKATV